MKARLLLTLAGLAISFAVPTFAQEKEVVDPQLLQQLGALDKKSDEAFNNNDAAAVAACFTKDAVLVTPLGTFSGRQAIEIYFRGIFQQYHLSDHISTLDHVYTLGDDLCAVGGWTSNSNSTPSHGHRVLVYRRDDDTWKVRVITVIF
jgi:uncharacterized protein (TIGR02246 family)